MYHQRSTNSPTRYSLNRDRIRFIVVASLPHLVKAKLADDAVAGLVVAIVVGVAIGAYCVYKISKLDKEESGLAYASNESRSRGNDVAQAQAEAETELNETK
ncbi:hypothetical protein IV203_009047 [Nitzschia inconspicua]|uniref:Uncharacterized protein n=1 Tax=Nitzschia inconspicua TaxID=303405 RepID=A0A9K3KZS3_9STRA|nr:hypothetical protein IV203_009047 [Nitzschia inconspicua]